MGNGALVFSIILVGIAGVVFAAIKFILKNAEAKQNWMAHSVDMVDTPTAAPTGEGESSTDPKVALDKYYRGLKQLLAPFDKIGGTLNKEQYEAKTAQLETLKARLAESGRLDDQDVQNQLVDAERNLARYAPKG